MAKKPPPKPPTSDTPKQGGLINQTGGRPGGTVTGSYKINYGAEEPRINYSAEKPRPKKEQQ